MWWFVKRSQVRKRERRKVEVNGYEKVRQRKRKQMKQDINTWKRRLNEHQICMYMKRRSDKEREKKSSKDKEDKWREILKNK